MQNTSLRRSRLSPSACSGDMYATALRIPVRVRASWIVVLAIPKSTSLTRPPWVTSTLCGETSR